MGDGGPSLRRGSRWGGLGVGLADVEACQSRQHHPAPGRPFGDLAAVIPQSPEPTGGHPLPPLTPAALTSCRLEVASPIPVVQAAGPLLPRPHQLHGSAAFSVLPPLTLTRTRSGWPLGGIFCHLEPGLAFLTFCGGGPGLLLLRAPARLGGEPSRSRKGGFLGRGVLLPSSRPGLAGSMNSGRAR